MLEFPLDLELSYAVLVSTRHKCIDDMLSIAAMMTAPSCFIEDKDELKRARDKHAK